MLKEFKNFILKGNVLDLAVAVIIGGAFSKIVDSVVKDLIMPLIGKIGGQPDFSSWAIGATKSMKDGKEVLEGGIMVGNFLNAVVGFLILTSVVFFIIVKPANKLLALMKAKNDTAAPLATPADIALLTEIRDLLKK